MNSAISEFVAGNFRIGWVIHDAAPLKRVWKDYFDCRRAISLPCDTFGIGLLRFQKLSISAKSEIADWNENHLPQESADKISIDILICLFPCQHFPVLAGFFISIYNSQIQIELPFRIFSMFWENILLFILLIISDLRISWKKVIDNFKFLKYI